MLSADLEMEPFVMASDTCSKQFSTATGGFRKKARLLHFKKLGDESVWLFLPKPPIVGIPWKTPIF
jgi:hypothetical protein